MTGFVSLVGAGPGDPELLTRARGATRSSEADLVLYDALVSPEVAGARADARSASPSASAPAASRSRQETIHRADDPRRARAASASCG